MRCLAALAVAHASRTVAPLDRAVGSPDRGNERHTAARLGSRPDERRAKCRRIGAALYLCPAARILSELGSTRYAGRTAAPGKRASCRGAWRKQEAAHGMLPGS